MKMLAALVGLFLAGSAFAATYDVTATMPSTSGATSCQLYIGGTAAGSAKPCGSAQTYPALIPTEGTYSFTYKAINAGGQSAASPATTVTVSLVAPPGNPGSPPTITVACSPAPCPANVVITISP